MSVFTMKATSGGGPAGEVPAEGSHAAVLVAIIDLGSHTEQFDSGDKTLRKVRLLWELPGTKVAGSNQPPVLGADYSLTSSNKSKLRQMLEGWRGRKFADGEEIDLAKVLGKGCILSVVHTKNGDRTYANVGGVTNLLAGMTPPVPTKTPFMWYIGCDQPVPEMPWLPWVYGKSAKSLIEASHEWKQGLHKVTAAPGGKPASQPANGKPAATPPAGKKKPAPPPPPPEEEEYQGSDVGEDADSIPF